MTNIFVNNRRGLNTYVGNRQRRSGKSTRTNEQRDQLLSRAKSCRIEAQSLCRVLFVVILF